MNLENIVKTLFSTYRYLDKMTKIVDKYVKAKAMSCLGANMNNVMHTSTLFVTTSLTYLINNKIGLINFKTITNSLLENMNKKNARFIIMKYIDGLKNDDLAKNFNVCDRTVFRWHNKAINDAVNTFQKLKFDDNKILSNFKNVAWVNSVYEDYNKQISCENIKYSEIHIFKKAYNEYKKIMAI